MKIIVTTLVVCFGFVCISQAQPITNGGFESWAAGNPTDWYTSNAPGVAVPVTQSANAHGGSFAVEGTVLWLAAIGSTYSPLLGSGSDGLGFPINFRPAAVRGWYTFATDSGDALSIIASFIKAGSPVGFGFFSASTPQPLYQEFVANTTYLSGETPDTAYFSITVSGSPRTHLGTAFKLDDLVYGPATDVNDNGSGIPSTFALEQNYPNPFNPVTKIQFQLPHEEFVTLKVYNMLGQEVAALVNGQLQPGRYRAELDAANLPSGMYFYRLQAGTYSDQKKLTVVK